jgi:aminopeptidase
MKSKFFLFMILMALTGYVANAQSTGVSTANADLEKVAAELVNNCAGISEGDIVMVSGGVKDMELLENIAVNVRKKGAFPLLTVNSDRLTRKMFTEVPEKYDSQAPKLGMHMVKFITAQIEVSAGETSDLLSDIPPERFKTRSDANRELRDYVEKNPIKMVALGNGMYPTKANADEFGISLEQLTEIFWSGVNVDYEKLSATGKKLESQLAKGNELEITNKNGTSLKVKVQGSQTFCSDGIIGEEDIKKGSAGYSVYLPAGEVYLAPVAGTANGKVVVDNYTIMGKPVEGLVMEFKNGKLVSMDAKTNLDLLKKYYKTDEKGMDEFSVIDFGINPNVVIPEGSKLLTWMPAGMVTVGVGNNIWAGGSNDASTGFSFFIPGSTVKLDGKTLVDNGNLKL